MQKNLNTQGYDISEISPNDWVLYVKGTTNAYRGNFKQIAKYAIEKLGFKIEELNMAIE